MRLAVYYVVSAIIVIADQITKRLADNNLQYDEKIVVNPFFNITLHYNKGAAWSFLANAGGWQRPLLTGISAVVSVFLIVWLYQASRTDRVLSWALTLILGGAIGNLIDRALQGYVIDFIQWHYAGWVFPTFNIADAAISVGAALFILSLWQQARREKLNQRNQQ